jgi:hypothetical protein
MEDNVGPDSGRGVGGWGTLKSGPHSRDARAASIYKHATYVVCRVADLGRSASLWITCGAQLLRPRA